MTPAALALLEFHSRDLVEVSNHNDLMAIAVGICMLPDPPAWAVENKEFVRQLGEHAAREVAALEADPFEVARELATSAPYEVIALGEPTFAGPADEADVAKGAALADALDALAMAVIAVGMAHPEPPVGPLPDAPGLTPAVLAVLKRHADYGLGPPVAAGLCSLADAPPWALAIRERVRAEGAGNAALVAAYERRRGTLGATLVRLGEQYRRLVPALADALLALAAALAGVVDQGASVPANRRPS